MASETEPAKLLLPYLQRADELQKHEPLVAYYCRLYAMERGLRIPQNKRTKTTNSLLISLMNQLEKDKKSLNLGPDDNLYVEGFSLNVFAKADKQDRAGRSDLNTAKTFYAASIFFEVLNQFGVPQPDLEQKQKYAAWKAADIRKALKEGRRPNPGPPSGEDDLSIPLSSSYDIGPSETTSNPRHEHDPSQSHDSVNDQHSTNIPPPSFQYHDKANDHHSHFHDEDRNNQRSINLPSVPQTYPTAGYPIHNFPTLPGNRPENSDHPHPYQQHQSYSQEPHQHLPHFQSYPSFSESSLPAVPPHHPSYYRGSDATQSNNRRNGPLSETAPPPAPEKVAEAQKAARLAVGALAFDDVSVAVDYLRKSLELLTNPSARAGR